MILAIQVFLSPVKETQKLRQLYLQFEYGDH